MNRLHRMCIRSIACLTVHSNGMMAMCRQGAIGFLKAQNRINVLLSRAQHGMYILGNATSLRERDRAKMWPRVSLLL